MTAAHVLAVWPVLAVAGCLAMHRARQARPRVPVYPPPVPEYVRRVDWRPPVPPPAPVYDDWLELMPVDNLSDLEVESRFWRLVAEAS